MAMADLRMPTDVVRLMSRIACAALFGGTWNMSPSLADQPAALWSAPAEGLVGSPDRIPDRIGVSGAKADGVFKPGGLVLPEPVAAAPVRDLPLGTELLSLFEARSFGVEERVKLSVDQARIAMSCAAGQRPAGLVFKPRQHRFPRVTRAALVLEGKSAGPLSFSLGPEGGEGIALAAVAAGSGGPLAIIPASLWALQMARIDNWSPCAPNKRWR